MSKILYGVGVGPGDPELLTLKAVKCLKQCGIIAVPKSGVSRITAYDIALAAVPEIADKQLLCLPMPMTKNTDILKKAHEEGAQMVLDALQMQDVAFLTLGDPSIYATYSYLQRAVEKKGGQCKTIPGIPSFCAVAAALGQPLVEGNQTLHIIPASYPIGDALEMSGTKVLMKSGSQFGVLKEELLKNAGDCSVNLVENCGMVHERRYYDVKELPDSPGYFSLVVVKEKK